MVNIQKILRFFNTLYIAIKYFNNTHIERCSICNCNYIKKKNIKSSKLVCSYCKNNILSENELIHNKEDPLNSYWKRFINGEIAINCETIDEAKYFLNYCSNKGLKWVNEKIPLTKTYWSELENKTSYRYDLIRKGLTLCKTKVHLKGYGLKTIEFKRIKGD